MLVHVRLDQRAGGRCTWPCRTPWRPSWHGYSISSMDAKMCMRRCVLPAQMQYFHVKLKFTEGQRGRSVY